MNFLFTLATILYCFFTIGTTAPQHARGKVLKHKKLRHPLFSFGLFVFGTLTACYIVRMGGKTYSNSIVAVGGFSPNWLWLVYWV